MKRSLLIATLAVAVAFVAIPAVAGDDHDHEEAAYANKCTADAQACLNWFATNYKGRGWAGVSLEGGEDGLRVTEVHPGTPAAKAGIKAGDVLLAINGIQPGPENREKMAALEQKMKPGNEFTYTIARDGKERDVTFALAEMPMDVVARMVGAHMLNDHAAIEVASADD